ncbi:MAG TPA: DUF3047 domain-containing protein [Ramlibacter sp.]|nr:DUF3047 domain-containing protein [Ramlibacter sp.]
MNALWRCAAAAASVVFLLAGCSSVPVAGDAAAVGASPWASQSSNAAARSQPGTTGWQHLTFPGKQATRFGYARKDGRDAVAVVASSSASMMRHIVRIEPADLGNVRFSWKVPQLIAGADMLSREADDSPVRIVLAFEGDRSRFSPRDAMLSELAQTLTGEPMPYATLMYVWCNKREPGTVLKGPRTDRIRKLVIESGAGKLDQWLDYERDIAADFRRAFGEDPGTLVAIGIMTDSDNTRSTVQAWYGPVKVGTRALSKR